MKNPKPAVDLEYPTEASGRIPAFHSIEEEAAFWDTHDFTDYLEESSPTRIEVGYELAERITLRLDEADRRELTERAREIGVGPSTLARMWLKERLRLEAANRSGSRQS